MKYEDIYKSDISFINEKMDEYTLTENDTRSSLISHYKFIGGEVLKEIANEIFSELYLYNSGCSYALSPFDVVITNLTYERPDRHHKYLFMYNTIRDNILHELCDKFALFNERRFYNV